VALAYPAGVDIPGTGTAASVRERVMSLLPEDINFRVFAPDGDHDTNNDGVDDEILTQATTALGEINPGPFMTVQFDCAPGTSIRPADFVCSIPPEGLSDAAGLPFAPELIAQVSCVVTLGGGVTPPPTTTTTSVPTGPTTTTTVVSTTTTFVATTTTTTPAACGNGSREAGEECDDGNSDPNDGCTGFCTICGNNIVTAPESCDDGMPPALNDNCPEDCRIDLCTPTADEQTVTIVASRPDLTGITFLLDYPDGRIEIPGSGDVSVQFSDNPGTVTALDLDHAVRVNVSDAFTFETTQIARGNFRGCQGAALPSPADYQCIVISAVDGTFTEVPGVTCSVTIP
jgi:cysteine-rich repeat protein